MQVIDLEAQIDQPGNIHLPDRDWHAYGRAAWLVVLLPDTPEEGGKTIDPMRYAGTLDWPVDGLD